MSTVKQDVESLLNRLPDNVSWKTSSTTSSFSIRCVAAGGCPRQRHLSQEEVETRFSKWLTE